MTWVIQVALREAPEDVVLRRKLAKPIASQEDVSMVHAWGLITRRDVYAILAILAFDAIRVKMCSSCRVMDTDVN